MSRITEIRDRLAAATPGPWRISRDHPADRPRSSDVCDLVNDTWVVSDSPLRPYVHDGALIANTPDDLAFLCSEVDRLVESLKGVMETCDVSVAAYGLEAHTKRINKR